MTSRAASLALLLGVLASGCNGNDLVKGVKTTPTPEPAPSPAPSAPPTPAPSPAYLGTVFFAADLDNISVPPPYVDPAGSQFAVAVSNPDETQTANVSITGASGSVASGTVGPGALQVFPLPRADVDGTIVAAVAYRIESDLPVTAHQFNPLANVGAFSNDASLLLPAAALGTGYRALAWPQSEASALPGFVTIVAAAEGATTVTVTVSTATRAGIDYPAQAAGLPWSIPAMSPGQQTTRVLKEYEAFSLQTASYGQDLSGTVITADRPVAVFAGAECANVPLGVTACDHLEEQLYPVDTWGQSYLAVKSRPRGTEPDLWRILADQNGTTVTTDPPQAGTPATLQAGQILEIVTAGSFRIDATAPVLVGELLVGQDYAGGSPTGYTGDPSYLLAVPVEQFRRDYVFLTPSGYTYDSVTLAAPADAQVSLDGVPIPASSFAPVGTTGWARAAIDLTDGVHRLESEVAFGASVTGFDTYVSYGYPAGMDLEVLSP